jgi:thymidylate synthase (FAD)
MRIIVKVRKLLMRVINQSIEFITPLNGLQILERIEEISRVCYKSEDLIKEGSAEKLVTSLVKNGHYAMIEHCTISIKVITDRSVSHEIVRHRMASYAQESQRYINYSKDKFGNEITFVKPNYWEINSPSYLLWESACRLAEQNYLMLLEDGAKPEEARAILPNSTKTEIVMTMNLREWRHFFELRCAKGAHPMIREVANMILKEFRKEIPIIFDDIKED